ncbi:hypothetical protein [Chlamydia sp. 17-3921]|uniref:hypothetical protein n=2 Tax=Chlamydia sp. 17-3921 TaxID=2675798 RepID=UPI001919C41C|nr:hypothetical protein [Chlamydia sp. 17-3921]
MTCYLLADRAGVDIHLYSTPVLIKVICILGDLLLLPLVSLIAGVVGTFFLLIKILSLCITYFLNTIWRKPQPSLFSRFSCLTKDLFMPHLAPVLLIPILGLSIYLGVLIQSFSKKYGMPSYLDITAFAVIAPVSLMVESATSWKPSPNEITNNIS